MTVRLVERKKVCSNPDCPRGPGPQPWSHFRARSRWEDGSVRNVQSRCGVCMAAGDRSRRAARPLTEAQRVADRALRREQYHARMADPDYRARRRAEQTDAYRERYRRDPEYARRNIESSRRYQAKIRADPVRYEEMKAKARARRQARKNERQRMLPTGPLRDWLEREIRSLSSAHANDQFSGASLLCTRGDVHPRTLRRWRREQDVVEMDSVDRFACRYGEPDLLRDLYPDLYEFDEDRAA